MKPLIGITPLYDLSLESIWMLPAYMQAIEKAGGLPVILDLSQDREILCQEAGLCNGILFTGGEDLEPQLYHQEEQLENAVHIPQRDRMEFLLLQQMIVRDKPVLGICRGHQLLNVFAGGTLYQDLPTQFSSQIVHHQSRPYNMPVHSVQVAEGSPLHKVCRQLQLDVNSLHHQGIQILGAQAQSMAQSEDGLCEAICLPSRHFAWGIQWHPELAPEWESSRRIFQAFVDAAKS